MGYKYGEKRKYEFFAYHKEFWRVKITARNKEEAIKKLQQGGVHMVSGYITDEYKDYECCGKSKNVIQTIKCLGREEV